MPHIHIKPGQHDVTVSAYIVRRSEGGEWSCLVHMHRKIGKLMQIGGHVELSESPWASLVHELREEGGYTLDELSVLQPVEQTLIIPLAVAHPVPVVSNTHRVTAEHYHSDYAYAFIADAPAKNAPALSESQDVRWFTIAELKKLAASKEAMPDTVAIFEYVLDRVVQKYHPVPAASFSTVEPDADTRNLMPTFYFTRHGESQANADGIRAGWSDSPLTEKGMIEARAEGERLKKTGVHFDVIISSPLSRAYDTAALIAAATGYPQDVIVIEDTLKERGFGGYENKPLDKLQPGDFEAIGEAGGETLDEFVGRVEKSFEILRQLSVGKERVLIVAHGGWYRMATALMERKDVRTFYELPGIENNKVVLFPL